MCVETRAAVLIKREKYGDISRYGGDQRDGLIYTRVYIGIFGDIAYIG